MFTSALKSSWGRYKVLLETAPFATKCLTAAGKLIFESFVVYD
ncbi:hypothetical protein DFA_08846 [Cavenderia fasciculata]|uniref:Uncharacterized protein n=1 Tax=Cavenderia fasciculata TaxID=261658 RepID=F4Q4J6_CACFS|nr:uncharacterized protein DFA_08846 [Cavenderia fasciculata]EGG17845.1 hypothetical protein DFA_08846 [Cavenderia fasciculata]|eukprot:XP_004356329.1 hypothetical protein DFA_08846 [Cavenderia fasciculata]